MSNVEEILATQADERRRSEVSTPVQENEAIAVHSDGLQSNMETIQDASSTSNDPNTPDPDEALLLRREIALQERQTVRRHLDLVVLMHELLLVIINSYRLPFSENLSPYGGCIGHLLQEIIDRYADIDIGFIKDAGLDTALRFVDNRLALIYEEPDSPFQEKVHSIYDMWGLLRADLEPLAWRQDIILSYEISTRSIGLQARFSSIVPMVEGAALIEHQRPAFIPYRTETDARDTFGINGNIYECLRAPRTPSRKPGWIYILESPESAPGHIKIGKTWRKPSRRRKEWRRCNMPLAEMRTSFRNAFNHYAIVESLVMAELHYERRKFRCTACGGSHDEWYEVNKELAAHVVNRWRIWIITQKPFNPNFQLTSYWRWRVERLPKELDDVRWDEWTQPALVDFILFKSEEFSHWVSPNLRAHFNTGRKDSWFWFLGIIATLLSFINFGCMGAMLMTLGLLVL